MTRQTESVWEPTAGSVPVALLVAALDLIVDGVALVDDDGLILFVNQPLCELVGYTADQLVGRTIEHLVPASIREDHRRHRADYALDPVTRRMGRSDLDIEIQHADGRAIPVDIQLTSVPGTSMVAATIRDMTTDRQAAADLALQRLDLIRAMHHNEQMLAYYDFMLQHLFAIGTHLQGETRDSERLQQSVTMIDDMIGITRNRFVGACGKAAGTIPPLSPTPVVTE